MARGITQAQEAAKSGGGGGSRDELIVEEGARALIRLLGDGSDSDVLFGVYAFHSSGNETTYKDEGLCRRELGEPCLACDQNLPRRLQIVCWVWVYGVYHLQQKMPDWEAVEVRGRGRAFKETVNAPKILRKGVGKARSFLELFVNYYDEYGALNDRDYLLSRSGSGFNTSYSIIPRGDKKELSREQAQARSTLPDILEYYTQKANQLAPVSLNGVDEHSLTLDEDTEEDQNEPPF